MIYYPNFYNNIAINLKYYGYLNISRRRGTINFINGNFTSDLGLNENQIIYFRTIQNRVDTRVYNLTTNEDRDFGTTTVSWGDNWNNGQMHFKSFIFNDTENVNSYFDNIAEIDYNTYNGNLLIKNNETGECKWGDNVFPDFETAIEFIKTGGKPVIKQTTLDFTAYVDGNIDVTAPNIDATVGLTWITNINDNPNDITKDDIKISYQFFAGNLNNHRLSEVVHYAPYSQKSVNFSYYDIIKEVLPDLYKKIITGEARIGEQAIVGCICWGWTDFELNNYDSGKFGFDFYFNGYYENDNTYGEVGDGLHHGSITVKTGQLIIDDEYKPFPNTYPNIPLDDMSVNTLNLISKSYSVSPNRLKQLNNALWGSAFIDNIKLVNNNPIENIVSIKMFPFNLNGVEENILLGNVDTGVKGLAISTAETYRHSFGKVTIPTYYKSFLDLHDTNIDLYLPFIGFITLDTYRVTGKEIEVQYIIDLLTGMVKAIVLCDNIVISESSCQIGIDIPISASNRASWEISQLINTASTAVDVASGNFGIGTMSNIANTVANSVTMPHKTTTKGSFSSICSAYTTLVPFIIIDRPTYQENTAFNHTKGRCCFLTKTLKNLSGFTIIDNNTDLTGISCLADEKTMILNILSSGFYI